MFGRPAQARSFPMDPRLLVTFTIRRAGDCRSRERNAFVTVTTANTFVSTPQEPTFSPSHPHAEQKPCRAAQMPIVKPFSWCLRRRSFLTARFPEGCAGRICSTNGFSSGIIFSPTRDVLNFSKVSTAARSVIKLKTRERPGSSLSRKTWQPLRQVCPGWPHRGLWLQHQTLKCASFFRRLNNPPHGCNGRPGTHSNFGDANGFSKGSHVFPVAVLDRSRRFARFA